MGDLETLENTYKELGKEIKRLKKSKKNHVGVKDDAIFLLSTTEYENHIHCIPHITTNWWLRSPGLTSVDASYVRVNGSVNDFGCGVNNDWFFVRPALRLDKINNLKKTSGAAHIDTNKFVYCGVTWVRIDDNLAVAEVPIAFSKFDEESNDYATSDIRKFLLDWYEERK